MGVSRKCVKTWIDRFDRPRARPACTTGPRARTRSPTKTSEEVEQRIVELRHRERRGPDWIGAELGVAGPDGVAGPGPPPAAPPRRVDPITGEVIRASKVTAVRYERDRPGELVHMDVKKLGRIPDGGGWRARPRAGQHHEPARATIGFDYVHSLVDDHSRLAYSEVLPDEKGATCAGFLARAMTTSPPTASPTSSG